jgi:ADP-ribose pyrophosphatase
MSLDADIETIATRLVYQNRWMRVREDQIRRRDGSSGIFGVVEKPGFVVIVPMDTDRRLHLVQQYRYPVGARFWEFPQGAWEAEPHADPLDVARGELREETGLEAAEMTDGGQLFQGYGYSTQPYHVFLATGLLAGEANREHEEQDLIARTFERPIAAFGLLRLKGLL